MPDSLPLPEDVLADALGIVVAEIRADWRRDLDRIKAEAQAVLSNHSAAVAEFKAEIATLRLQARDIKAEPGDKGEPGPMGEPGCIGDPGVGIASIERRDHRLFIELDDQRVFDAGDIAGDKGEPGPQGPPGNDGTAASADLIKAVAELEVHKAVQAIPIPRDGKDGRDGIDGKDGLSFEEFEETFDGERTVTRTYRRGDKILAVNTYKLASVIYRRVWKDGTEYDRGDLVTWRGSLWHCNELTTDAPGDGVSAWTLAAKRGADGRNGKDGEPGPRGPEGKAGRDMKY